MRILPWLFVLVIAIIFAFTSYKEVEKTNVNPMKVYNDTIIFGDSVVFECIRCNQINIQYVFVKVVVPKCQ